MKNGILLAAAALALAFLTAASHVFGQAPSPAQDAKAMRSRPLDPNFPIGKQLNGNDSPVMLVNIFTVDEKDVDAFKKAWEADAEWMKKQPGFVSTPLRKGAGGGTVFMNYAVWESTRHFRDAFTSPEFRNKPNLYPASTVASAHRRFQNCDEGILFRSDTDGHR